MTAFLNSANNAFQVFSGDALLDTAKTLFGEPSMQFAGGTYLRDITGDAAANPIVINTGDFSIDGWASFAGLSGSYGQAAIIGKALSAAQSFYIAFDGTDLRFTWSTNGSGAGLVSLVLGAIPTDNSFFHFEVTRSGNTVYGFINGALRGSAAIADFFNGPTARTTIGRIDVSSFEFPWQGNIRELRVTRAARHTSAFTVPTTPPGDSTASDPLWNSVVAMIHGTSYWEPAVRRVAVTQILASDFAKIPPVLARVLTDPRRVVQISSGRGRIVGTVKRKDTPVNVPLARKVWLLDEQRAAVVRETLSAASDGSYEFGGIDESGKFTVIAYDYMHDYRAVIADNLTPEPMP
jgi:hypothetical protein